MTGLVTAVTRTWQPLSYPINITWRKGRRTLNVLKRDADSSSSGQRGDDRWRFRGHSPAVRRSQAMANSSPPPRATPSIAAMVGAGNDAARALQERKVQKFLYTHSGWGEGETKDFLTYLRHQGSQAVNKQIRLSVVHQSSLFQVSTYVCIITHTTTHHLDRLWSQIQRPSRFQRTLTCTENTWHWTPEDDHTNCWVTGQSGHQLPHLHTQDTMSQSVCVCLCVWEWWCRGLLTCDTNTWPRAFLALCRHINTSTIPEKERATGLV